MKKLFLLIFTFLTVFVFSFPCSAATVERGTINSSVLTYLTGVVNKLPPGTEYFMYKSGDYTVDLIYGSDLTYQNNIVTGSGYLTRLQYNLRNYVGSSYDPSFTEMQLSSFSCNTDSFSICYSSLGRWPALGDTGNTTLTYILWSLVFFGFLFLILKFIRNRRHYINL